MLSTTFIETLEKDLDRQMLTSREINRRCCEKLPANSSHEAQKLALARIRDKLIANGWIVDSVSYAFNGSDIDWLLFAQLSSDTEDRNATATLGGHDDGRYVALTRRGYRFFDLTKNKKNR